MFDGTKLSRALIANTTKIRPCAHADRQRGTKSTVGHYPDIMQKLFDAGVDYPLVLVSANEEFPRASAKDSEPLEHSPSESDGWSAFEIWNSRIRLSPGVTSLFLPRP